MAATLRSNSNITGILVLVGSQNKASLIANATSRNGSPKVKALRYSRCPSSRACIYLYSRHLSANKYPADAAAMINSGITLTIKGSLRYFQLAFSLLLWLSVTIGLG